MWWICRVPKQIPGPLVPGCPQLPGWNIPLQALGTRCRKWRDPRSARAKERACVPGVSIFPTNLPWGAVKGATNRGSQPSNIDYHRIFMIYCNQWLIILIASWQSSPWNHGNHLWNVTMSIESWQSFMGIRVGHQPFMYQLPCDPWPHIIPLSTARPSD